ncbi:MAG: histone deacetylase family protein [Rhodospirillales bacterium]|nr:MAG: histone deacetylase family protein [Rhodospirillales bacterium]
MSTILYSHPACIEHDMGPMHPESPARLRAVLDALGGDAFSALIRREAPAATTDQIARVHPRDYVERLLAAIPESGRVQLDPDTAVGPASGEAALRAAGAVCAAVDDVIAGKASNAFCAVRPPGHHAEPSRPMGFCLFNNVAVGAEQARAVHGLGRVAVVDFDVHHGNGTQAMFWDDKDLFYASTHQSPHYPGTGSAAERGSAGNIVNAPLPPFTGSAEFREAMQAIILPALAEFAPEFLLISAGFDAHADDPLASLELDEDDFAWATRQLMDVADRHCDGRIVSTLEGGYDLAALGRSAAAHVRTLMTA